MTIIPITPEDLRRMIADAVADARSPDAPAEREPDDPVWFNRQQLQERWGVSVATIRQMEALGSLGPVLRVESDRVLRYFWAYVLAYEGRMTQQEADAVYYRHSARVHPLKRAR